jgi:uncharacterized RDD family membrane protein YckC
VRTNTLIVNTPEGIQFPLLLAGPVTRFLAWLVDWVCVLILLEVFSVIITLTTAVSSNIALLLWILGYFTLTIGYGIAFEWFWRGQTVGKRLLRLRVMDAQGLRLHSSQIVIRNLLRAVDMLPGLYLLGGAICLLSRHAQRLGDLAANTIVVRQPKTSQPDLDKLLADKFNSFREHPHLTARLHQRISPAEARIALQALLRRDDLEPSARVELFSDLVNRFRMLVPFPPETTDGLSDEQYVRNVADILFRR